jgi:hypothetical protein
VPVRCVSVVVALLSLAALAAEPAGAGTAPVKPLKEWTGRVKDQKLRKLAPKLLYIVTQNELAKLWKAWEIKDKLPEVDFTRQLVLVAAAPSSRLTLKAALDDKGDLKVLAAATADLRPDFGYHILLISREGVKTINGKPVLKA